MARRKKNNQPRQFREQYLIIVDGDDEKWYFEAIKNHRRMDKFRFKPEIDTVTEELLKTTYLNLNTYSKVYWIIDFDVVLKEEKERKASKKKKNKKTKLQLIKEYYNKNENFVILINNPCLEVWLLMHFVYKNPEYHSCKGAIDDLKKFVSDYSKSRKFYLDAKNDIYNRLKDKQQQAIDNAKKLGYFDLQNTSKTLAEIYKLVELILETSQEKL